jgi:hypothetical protein
MNIQMMLEEYKLQEQTQCRRDKKDSQEESERVYYWATLWK